MGIAALRKKLITTYGLTVKQKTVIAGNIKTFYLSAGTGEPLVLLHGAGGGAVLWGPIIDLLSKHFHIIAPDVVGYGESDKPDAPYDKKFFSTWLCKFCDSLNIEKIEWVLSQVEERAFIEFSQAIAKAGGDYRVCTKVLEVDESTETLQVVVEGNAIDFEAIQSGISDLGGSLHSIDEVEVQGEPQTD